MRHVTAQVGCLQRRAGARHPLALWALLAWGGSAVAGCAEPEPGEFHTAIFTRLSSAQTADTFFDQPFPTDLRRRADGKLDLTGLPQPTSILSSYVRAMEERLDGFGLNAAMYARFSSLIDTDTLPNAAESMEAGASVYLVNVDRESQNYGERIPIELAVRDERSATLGANALVARPYPGFPLDEGTTYAWVISDRMGAAASETFVAARRAETSSDREIAAIQTAYAPLWEYLDTPGGDERATVVSAAVFTTQHATDVVRAVRATIAATPAPVARAVSPLPSTSLGVRAYSGEYDAPNFQRGLPPYDTQGDIAVDANGRAAIQRTETLRFAVAVPTSPVPKAGWPLAVYQHGTGGDYQSFLRDGTAARLAEVGIASISMDQVLHGPRNPGRDPALDFFNFTNPLAGRDNVVQGAADSFSLARLGLGLTFSDGEVTHRFDPARLYFFGHSQGSTTGALYAAFADDLKAAVLSGAGGGLYLTLLEKRKPVDIPTLAAVLLGEDPFDVNSPSLAILQTWIERADAMNYGRYYARAPGLRTDGTGAMAPRNVLVTEGLSDGYTPNVSTRAFAVAIGGSMVEPVLAPVPGMALRQRPAIAAPVQANLAGATLGHTQYRPGTDGHFVVFEIPAARRQTQQFLGTHAATGVATVVTPAAAP